MLAPDENPDAYDYLGAEDPRITPLEDGFCMVYCGVVRHYRWRRHPVHDWRARVCLAWSRDLVHWEKLGPIVGHVNAANNKDGALLPGKVRGRHLLLHRPMVGEPQDFAIALGEDRFVEIHHTGNRLALGGVEYDLECNAIVDFGLRPPTVDHAIPPDVSYDLSCHYWERKQRLLGV